MASADRSWSRTLPRILPPDQADWLAGVLRTHRDRTVLLVGLRRCEMLGLRLADVQVAGRAATSSPGRCQVAASPAPRRRLPFRALRALPRLQPGCGDLAGQRPFTISTPAAVAATGPCRCLGRRSPGPRR